jgi:hypothetical protein
MYDLDADTLTLKFKAVRHLTQDESDLIDAAFASGEAQRYIQLTTSEVDGAKAQPVKAIEAPKASLFDEPEEEEEAEPVKRAAKKPAIVDAPVGDKDLSDLLGEWAED